MIPWCQGTEVCYALFIMCSLWLCYHILTVLLRFIGTKCSSYLLILYYDQPTPSSQIFICRQALFIFQGNKIKHSYIIDGKSMWSHDCSCVWSWFEVLLVFFFFAQTINWDIAVFEQSPSKRTANMFESFHFCCKTHLFYENRERYHSGYLLVSTERSGPVWSWSV